MADLKLTRTIGYKEYLEIQKKRLDEKIKLFDSTKLTDAPDPFSVDLSFDPSATDLTDSKTFNIKISGAPVKSSMGNLLDGDAWVPIPPGATVSIPPGAKIYLPLGSKTVLTVDGVDTLIEGKGVLTPISAPNGGSFTAPVVSPTELALENPTDSNGSYPVILTIDRIVVIEDGVNYKPGDKVVITPSNGASATAKITGFGRVDSVTVTNSGVAFDEIPEIRIESETGFGAVLRPVFKINRLRELTDKELQEIENNVPKDKIIKVIDCVGKFT